MAKHIFLLPCPFCGEPAKMFYGPGYVTAGCDNESCEVLPSVDAKNSGEDVAENVAKIWNTRP
jgi:hypothetical protein